MDLRLGRPEELGEARALVAKVPPPARDPVGGAAFEYWNEVAW